MKKYLALLAALALFALAGCAPKESQHKNATLVAVQEPEDDGTGLLRGTCSITWEEGVVTSVRLYLDYATEAQAQTAYEAIVGDYGDAAPEHDIAVDGLVVSYKMSTAAFAGVTYEGMVSSYKRDGEWTVVTEPDSQ